MARLNYVPLHSIIVVRDNKQVDAFVESGGGPGRPATKAFKFEQGELDEIAKTYATEDLPDGSLDQALRAPANEDTAAIAAPADPIVPATSSTQAKTAVVTDTSNSKPDNKADAGSSSKDTDL